MARSPEKPRVRVPAASSVAGDSIQNFAARVGLGTNNLQSATFFGFNPITRNRQQLEWAYRGSWIVRQVVDAPAEDMARAGVEFKGQLDPQDLDGLYRAIRDLMLWQQIAKVIKWARLYGGAAGVLMIDGQQFDQPLRVDTIGEGQFRGIAPVDRWTLNPTVGGSVAEFGPDFGMPMFYDSVGRYPGIPQGRIHYSRVIRMDGEDLPIWQKMAENGWGLSVCEPLWDVLLAFGSGTQGAAQLLHKAYLRTLKIKGFREAIASTGKAAEAIAKNVDWIRLYQSAEGMTMLDAEDTFETHTYSFGGISDVLLQLSQQLSGATQIPLVRLFGQSPAGLNATGDADIRNYYDSILAQQETTLRRPMSVLFDVLHRSVLGRPPASDFGFLFNPLWQMSAKERVDIAVQQATALKTVDDMGAIGPKVVLSELRQMSDVTGMWTNITDEMINNADEDPPEPIELDPTVPEVAEAEEEGAAPKEVESVS